MPVYYNEIDPKPAAWLRELIRQGHIAPGDVDERSIEDVRPTDLIGYDQCHFFAGIGVWSYALRCAGWPDDRPVWTGSCPCQPFSAAGKGGGFDDERHLWPAFHWLIDQCDPAVVFGEQVAQEPEWLGLVHRDLEALGRAVGAIPMEAACAGAATRRDRFWFVSDTKGSETGSKKPKNSSREAFGRWTNGSSPLGGYVDLLGRRYRSPEPGICLLANGSSDDLELLRGYGNGLVAPAAQAFIEAYLETEEMKAAHENPIHHRHATA